MLLGPVFRAELLRTARRRWYYRLRVIVGLMLLLVVWTGYESSFGGRSTVLIAEAAQFAEATFASFATIQLIAILLMVPAVYGGAIADEKQRKTLHYLMASRLSGFEIVVDKVLGRTPYLATFLALGLPVVCLLGLFGGVPPEYVAIAYVGTASTAASAVALTVLVSTVSRRVRQAVLVSYVLLIAWQLAPVIVDLLGRRLYPATYDWIEPVNTWVGAATPFWVYVMTQFRLGPWGRIGATTTAYIVELFAWMVGLQLGAAAVMILLAVWRLRPAFRRHEATQARRNWFGDRKRRKSRPPCGADAMFWKERHFARTDLFTKLVVLPATIFASTLLVLASGIDESLVRAGADIWRGQFGLGGGETLIGHVRMVSAWYVAIWLLAIAGSSASSMTVEREQDTWINLTSTPLTGLEIVRGKVLGAVWAQRGFLAIPLLLWVFALGVGALHPLAFLGAVVMLALVGWTVAAVGVHASLRAPTTSRALGRTIATLAVLSGYPIFLVLSFTAFGVWGSYAAWVGFPARLAVGPLATYGETASFWRVLTVDGPRHLPRLGEMVMGACLSACRMPTTNNPTETWLGNLAIGACLATIDLAVAAVFTHRAVARFDQWLDRPRLDGVRPATGPGRRGVAMARERVG